MSWTISMRGDHVVAKLKAAMMGLWHVIEQPGARGYLILLLRLALAALLLAGPVILIPKIIMWIGVPELALIAPVIAIGLLAFVTSAPFQNSRAGRWLLRAGESLFAPAPAPARMAAPVQRRRDCA